MSYTKKAIILLVILLISAGGAYFFAPTYSNEPDSVELVNHIQTISDKKIQEYKCKELSDIPDTDYKDGVKITTPLKENEIIVIASASKTIITTIFDYDWSMKSTSIEYLGLPFWKNIYFFTFVLFVMGVIIFVILYKFFKFILKR